MTIALQICFEEELGHNPHGTKGPVFGEGEPHWPADVKCLFGPRWPAGHTEAQKGYIDSAPQGGGSTGERGIFFGGGGRGGRGSLSAPSGA